MYQTNVFTTADEPEHLINCASDLYGQLKTRWENRGGRVELVPLADLAYWRFCRFASYLTGRLVELQADHEALTKLTEILGQFVELTSDILANSHARLVSEEKAFEQIQRANVHCQERAIWLEEKAKEVKAFLLRSQKLSKKLAGVGGA